MGCFHTFCNHHTEVKLPHRTLTMAVDALLLPQAVGRRDVCSSGWEPGRTGTADGKHSGKTGAGTGKKTPGGAGTTHGTHTTHVVGHTGHIHVGARITPTNLTTIQTQRHIPARPAVDHAHDHATAETAADSTAAGPEPTAPRGRLTGIGTFPRLPVTKKHRRSTGRSRGEFLSVNVNSKFTRLQENGVAPAPSIFAPTAVST